MSKYSSSRLIVYISKHCIVQGWLVHLMGINLFVAIPGVYLGYIGPSWVYLINDMMCYVYSYSLVFDN